MLKKLIDDWIFFNNHPEIQKYKAKYFTLKLLNRFMQIICLVVCSPIILIRLQLKFILWITEQQIAGLKKILLVDYINSKFKLFQKEVIQHTKK